MFCILSKRHDKEEGLFRCMYFYIMSLDQMKTAYIMLSMTRKLLIYVKFLSYEYTVTENVIRSNLDIVCASNRHLIHFL